MRRWLWDLGFSVSIRCHHLRNLGPARTKGDCGCSVGHCLRHNARVNANRAEGFIRSGWTEATYNEMSRKMVAITYTILERMLHARLSRYQPYYDRWPWLASSTREAGFDPATEMLSSVMTSCQGVVGAVVLAQTPPGTRPGWFLTIATREMLDPSEFRRVTLGERETIKILRPEFQGRATEPDATIELVHGRWEQRPFNRAQVLRLMAEPPPPTAGRAPPQPVPTEATTAKRPPPAVPPKGPPAGAVPPAGPRATPPVRAVPAATGGRARINVADLPQETDLFFEQLTRMLQETAGNALGGASRPSQNNREPDGEPPTFDVSMIGKDDLEWLSANGIPL